MQDKTKTRLLLGSLALGWAIAAASGSATAHADPLTPQDERYVYLLEQADIHNSYGPAALVQAGHEICSALQAYGFNTEVARIQTATNLDGPHANYWVSLSQSTYCPAKPDPHYPGDGDGAAPVTHTTLT